MSPLQWRPYWKFHRMPKEPLNREPFPAAPENAWSDRAVLTKIMAPTISTVEPNATSLNAATQFIPRPAQFESTSKSVNFFQTNVQYDVNNNEFLLKPNGKFLPDEKSNC
ncbi:hypothetical protein AVEN_268193-1 [Araneus ventricosus]|uniref:Uncharacterized protein n=1 Tax=Araneus ventricosus TaxID=182803 RepID=A0A4Y2NYV0_ARAVE|nr:hypothetical protein AVEN_268193-1 [Araneus ventricosus]